MSPERQAWVFAGATVALWSTVATAFELGLRVLDPVTLLAGANAVAVVALLVIVAARGDLGATLRTSRRDQLRSLGAGLLNPFAYYLILFEAYDRLPGQVAQPLNYTWAITLALLSVPVLGQRLARGEVPAMILAWFGVVVIAGGGSLDGILGNGGATDDGLGIALALASTLVWSAYWLLAARDPREPVGALLLAFAWGLPFTLAAALLFGEPADWGALAVGSIVWVGLAEMAISFVFWRLALQRARSTAAISTLIFLSPFVSLVLLALVVGETIRPGTPVGLVLVVAGLALQQRARARAA